jgi:O-antigen/teichoic acid export membrane protein
MQDSKKFAFDVSITFFSSVVSLPLGFVIIILLGRYLGAGDLGLFRMISTIYGIAMLVAAIGIPSAMIKFIAESKEDRTKFNQIVSSGVITSLVLGIGFIPLFYFSSGIFAGIFDMPRLSGLIKILSPVFPFALLSGALLGLLNGLREMKRYAVATIIQSILVVLITVPLIYFGFGVAGAVIGIVLSSFGSCAFLIWTCREYYDITFEGYRQTTRKLLELGARIFGANAINMINYQADIVLIGYFLTATDVGYYAVAVGLSKFFWIIPQAIQRITYPATSRYWANNNHSALQTMIDKSMKFSACILLPVGLGVGFFAKGIITMIFGEGFGYSVLPLQILLVGTIINGVMQRPIGSILYSIGMPDLNLKIFASAAMTNLILNLILIPHFGIAGAAVATAISLSLIMLLILFYTIKETRVIIDFRWFTKIYLIAVACILLYHFLRGINHYFAGGVAITAFLFIMWFYFLSREDKVYFIDTVKTAKLHYFKHL